MRTLFFVCLILGAGLVKADDVPALHPYVRGVMLNDVQHRSLFSFQAGDFSECKRKELTGLIIYDCVNKNSLATVTDPTGAMAKFTFSSLRVTMIWSKGDVQQAYTYSGVYFEKSAVDISSGVDLTLWHWRSKPNEIRGSIRLIDYNTSTAIQAVPATKP